MRPSSAMQKVCSQALEWHRDHPDRRTFVEPWMLRFARSVDSAKQWATVERVHRWFDDHADYRGASKFFDDDDPGPERLAWDMLGGDPGQRWAATIIDAGPKEYSTTMELLEQDPDDTLVASGRRWDEFAMREEDWADPDVYAQFVGRRPEWAGLLCFEEVLTSDNRIISAGGLTWRKLPFTLQDQLQSSDGHDGSVPVGPTISIDRIPAAEVARLTGGVVELPDEAFGIWGAGLFDTGEDGMAARRRMEEGTKQGVSVDLTEIVLDLPDDPEDLLEIMFGGGELRILTAKIAAHTLVSIPAFEDARLRIIGDMPEMEPEALVASGGLVEGLTLRAVAPFSGVWVQRIDPPVQVTVEDEFEVEHVEWVDDRLEYTLEHLDALVASGPSRRPPSTWFSKRRYLLPTPVTLSDPDPDHNGLRRIHGHLGVKGSCHISFADRCVDVPMGLDYDSFQSDRAAGTVTCSDGVKVKAGPIVMATEHAGIRDAQGRHVPAGTAIDHYAHTGCLVAQGRCYEDQFGVQVQGWVLPDVTDEQLARLDACDLSPDWRPRVTASGGRGVVALLTVNVSGFNTALVASGNTWTHTTTGPASFNSGMFNFDLNGATIAGTITAKLGPRVDWAAEQALAVRKMEALRDLGLPVPDGLEQLAMGIEPKLDNRKTRVLAALKGECGCGGPCCQ